MMYLSTTHTIMRNIYGEKRKYTVEEAVKALKKAGYDRIDISLWVLSARGGIIESNNWEEEVLKIAEACRENGLPVYQTHGNTASGKDWDDPEYDWDYLTMTNLRNIKATAMLGAKWMVVHPMNLPRDPLYSARKAREANIKYLAPYIEEAKKQGIGIAVENMVDFRNWRRRYCGGDIYELIDLVDTIGDPSVGICLDTGHANLAGIECGAAIREIGPRLKATHINDNHRNGQDEHLFPYFGTVDWKDTMKALGEIGYEGDFAYEAGSQRIPDISREAWLAYTAALGRNLMEMA
ncbi:MAG: sugar phosphate isomerase/epimerase [Clostridia bacterium]|nr:sugar phosphate isomerase/epimerase [Clostridia bacterium]